MRAAEVLPFVQYAALVHAASGGSGRPRGVSPEFAKFYTDKDTFACISDASLRLPFSRVNDDFCDCPDGSDEPGTSACAHLSPLSALTLPDVVLKGAAPAALPGFYCENRGHIPAYVPFASVNDGVCDHGLCCDGSEEWAGVVKCEDRCKEIGREWRKADEARQKSLGAAAKRRAELVAEAGRLKQEVRDRIQTLGTEIRGAEARVTQLERDLAEIEKKEKGKIVRGAAAGGENAGKLAHLTFVAKQRTEDLRRNLAHVREQRDADRGRLVELETLLAAFKEEYNPNFNDEGVKRAVRAWEDYAARDKGPERTEAEERDLDFIADDDKANGLDWEWFETVGVESDTDVLYAFENYLPPSVRGWIDQKLRDLRVMLVENGVLAGSSSTAAGGESKPVTDARARVDTAKLELEGHRTSLREHEEDLGRDFGPDDVFRAVKGQCVSVDSGEYTYEVCFMDKTTQKSKKGGGDTNMGRYERLEKVVVDDEPPASGKGLGSGERFAMVFEHGQHCWNGPDRRTTVIMACSEQNEVWKVMEEEKCVYRMEVGTPAVCEGAAQGAGEGEKKRDEL